MSKVDRNTKYFDIKKLTGFGDIVSMDDIHILKEYTPNIINFKETSTKLISTVSEDVLNRGGSYVGARHCQEGQGGTLYKLVLNNIYECEKSTPAGAVGGRKQYKNTRQKRMRKNRKTQRKRQKK